MKRVMLVFVLGILLVSFASATTNVAYILRNPQRADAGFVEAFEEMGMNVELIRDTDIKETDFSQYSLIFIGDTRLRNVKYIPVDKFPSVIANKYYARLFGLMSRGGISKLAANQPLKVQKNGDIVEAYTDAKLKKTRTGVPYYYIPEKYKEENMESIATTVQINKRKIGDVVSYSTSEAGKCFFGIVKTEFWTEESRELFRQCVDFTVGVNRIHDVEIVGDYTNSVNGVRIKDVDSGEYLIDEHTHLECGKSYKIDFKTMNNGDYTENVEISGSVNGFDWDATKTGLEPGKSTTTGSKTVEIDDEFPVGPYTIEISAMIDGDANPGDNVRVRAVEVVCEE